MKITLRAARVNCGLTQEAVAQYLGFCRLTVQRWEMGLVMPNTKVLGWLCELYDVSKDDLIIYPDDLYNHEIACDGRYNVRLYGGLKNTS